MLASTGMEVKSKVGQAWYEVADHLDREDVMSLLKIVLSNCVFSFRESSINNYMGLQWVLHVRPWWLTYTWSILRRALGS